MKINLILLLGVLFLSGCASNGIGRAGSVMWNLTTDDQQKMTLYKQKCYAYGVKPNTIEWSSCIMKVEQNYMNMVSQNKDQVQEALKGMSQSSAPTTPKTTTCRELYGKITCNTF